MNYKEALEYIHSVAKFGSNLGLSRINALLEKLGSPQKGMNFIHVAGTNGKGSVSAMCDSVLRSAGYNCGLYTSPYIVRFNERMRIGGEEITDEELAELITAVRSASEQIEGDATEFELITAAAFLWFKRRRCDIVVLEVGLGGRLDATNVIEKSLVSVITGIALDHVAVLGGTVPEIAAEKAGIIKNGCPVVYGGADDDAFAVICRKALDSGCPLRRTERSALNINSETINGTRFDYGDTKNLFIPLCGSYQPENAATAIEALRFVKEQGFAIPEGALRKGLSETIWRARFEVLETYTPVIFDGAHNVQGVTASVHSIKQYFGEAKAVLLMGVLSDKDYRDMVSLLAPVAAAVFTVTPDSPRALSCASLAKEFESLGVPAKSFADIPSAVENAYAAASKSGNPLVMLGSLYMYGDVYKAFKDIVKKQI